MRPRRVPPRSTPEIAQEWDRIANLRRGQIDSELDLSYHRVLLPTINALFPTHKANRVVDVGCGLGTLTRKLASRAEHVVGVDPSAMSIAIARDPARPVVATPKFVLSTIEEYAQETVEEFDVAIANMVLMTMPELRAGLRGVAKLLRTGGAFIFTITHPWFWPLYWSYKDEPWFKYEEEIFIEAPFHISFQRTDYLTTHIHRPLHSYATALTRAGLIIEELAEPMPSGDLPNAYLRGWQFPRFLAGRCFKESLSYIIG